MFFGNCVSAWCSQRIFALLGAVLFFFIAFWFFPKFTIVGGQFVSDLLFMNPIQISVFVFLVFFLLFHALMGLKVIIRDYSSCSKLRFALFVFLDFLSCVTFVLFVVAVLLNSQVFS